MARYYGTTTQRGYGTRHQQIRARLLKAWRPGDPCARCGQPMWQRWLILPGGSRVSAIDLGHTDDRTGYTGLEHRRCNRSAGSGNANRGRTTSTRPRTAGRDYGRRCAVCGTTDRHPAQNCVICGGHFHPGNGRVQPTCSRTCGIEYKRRRRLAASGQSVTTSR